MSKEVIDFLWMWRGSYMGLGTDLTPALGAFGYGLPGGSGLGVNTDTEWLEERNQHTYKEDFHFPDGNASVARMLVRHMIPQVAPGSSMHDIISAKFDYTMLDRKNAPVRIRLNSTVLNVAHKDGAQSAEQVEITYANSDATLSRVLGKHCILACYNAIIPHICPELPHAQKDALHKMIRTPLVSVSVLIDNWQAFKNLGIFAAYCPGSYFSDIRLSYPLKFEDYQSARSPEEPICVHMYHIPVSGEGTASVQFRAGRWELLDTPFEVFEENIRTQLGAMLKDGGFDPARDIKGIIVNRWPHGYAMGYDQDTDTINWLSDDPWPEERMHWIKGRKKHGRVAVANSDAGAQAMTEAAIEQGHRAVQELLNG